MKRTSLLLLILAAISFRAGAENEIGFIETFALAKDREAALQQLVPGTEDYYFFSALHFQNTKQDAKLKDILAQWGKRFPNSDRRRIIENRAQLLSYDADPQATLKFLRERLSVDLNHEQQARDQKPDLPTTLDQARIARGVFLEQSLQADDLGSFSMAALEQLVLDKTELRPAQRRALLSKLTRPDVPGLVEIIAEDLKTQESKGFGEFPIHRALLPDQLADLQKGIPSLAENEAFVLTRLQKLLPSADVDLEFNRAEKDAWLTRAWDFSKTLPASFNTLKAGILRQRLEFDRRRGIYNQALFLEYLKLPRRFGYVNPKHLQTGELARFPVQQDRGFTDQSLPIPPIANDEPLVRDYFLHFFIEEASWEPYTPWVRDTWLKPVFAEAKIVNGVGDPEKWASLISPSDFQRLKERVDVEFAPANPADLAPGDAVALDLFIKHAPKLLVKIYRINALSYFLAEKKQLNTDLNLDGLVANSERTEDFGNDAASQNPFRRMKRTFKFPELSGRGAWMVEFIGGGKSSRALIRKGQWSVIAQAGPAGDLLTVLDEEKAPVKDAAVWLDGRRFTPDEKTGQVLVPFTQQPGTQPVILANADGTFASLTEFEHHAENYVLDASFHVEREQLLAGKEATLIIRAMLLVNGAKVSMDLLQDAKLTLRTTTLDGVETSREITGLKFEPGKDFTHVFKVPDRLASLSAELSGKVEVLSKGGEKSNLQASHDWKTNGVDRTPAASDGHLSKFDGNFVFELLGKNGETIPDRQIVFQFRHEEFYGKEVTAALRTDENGRINLGPLAGISAAISQAPETRNEGWSLEENWRTRSYLIHVRAGVPFQVPWSRPLTPGAFSLLEVRGGTFTADRSDAVILPPESVRKDGQAIAFLTIGKLPDGDYSLRLRNEDIETTIRVTSGKTVRNWIIGDSRELEISDVAPLNVTGIVANADVIEITVANANEFTRVHIAASRFLAKPGFTERRRSFLQGGLGAAIPERLPALYSGERDIGDEYRYILERRYAQKFPGNMLSRPGLILNPWEKRTTDADALSQSGKEDAKASAGARGRRNEPPRPPSESRDLSFIASGPLTPNLGFLATAAPVILNLKPDAQGVVRIDRKLLGDRQYIQVYAEDLNQAVWETLALDEVPTKFEDRRLVRNLDPAKPFTEKKEVSLLGKGEALTVADMLTSEIESYDTLGGIFTLFTTLSGDENLAKFAWVTQWPKLPDAEKRAKYSEFACHELSFFLSRKDPQFFAAVVQPYLRNKKDKTFMDDFLIEADLKPYLAPWSYGRLNVVERALLGVRLPDEAANAARHLRESWELLTPQPEENDRLFETALRGRALGGEGGLGIEFALMEQKMEAPAIPGLEPAPAAAAPAAAKPKRRMFQGGAPGGGEVALKADDKPPEELAAVVRQKTALDAGALAEAGEVREQLGRANVAFSRADTNAFFDMDAAQAQRGLGRAMAYYRKLGPTKEWAENNYHQLPIEQQNADLVTINAFWRDFAAWIADGKKAPFLSKAIAEAHHSFTEMILALAVIDLPFDAPKHDTKADGSSFTLTAGGPVIVYHKEIKPAQPAPDATELLVSQNFFRLDDRFTHEGSEQVEKTVTAEFLSGVVYGTNVVVTNPTSTTQKLDALLQIPQGALPVNGSKATDSRHLRLEPYTTQKLEQFFYFPAAREQPFPHYPVHVAKNEAIVGAAKATAFNVVAKPTQIDKATWSYVSQYGADAEVFAFLEQNNLQRLDLELVAWRARKSVDFFRKLVGVLEKVHVWNEPVYRYALLHNDIAPLQQWLRHRDDFIQQCGAWLDSKPLRIDPIERRAYEHLEYSPLVNQRIHRLGSEPRIANDAVRSEYQGLLNILAFKPSMDAMDDMSVSYFLFLQGRIAEALPRFRGIDAAALPTRLQHDYFRCYADFYEEKLPEARQIAAQYADFGVDRWRRLFAEVTAQLDEIEGKAAGREEGDGPDREKQQAAQAAAEPSFDFKVENRTVTLTHRNLKSVTVNYYLMDPEFLFSANPFVSEDSTRFSFIMPTMSKVQPLPADTDHLEIPLPAEFAKANVLVEILGAGQRKAEAHHANSFKLTVAENYGRLEVRDADNKAVSKAYVKVYARLRGGVIRFFKDGYTDLRGKFDYASLNSSEKPAPQPPRPLANPASGSLGYQMLKPEELDAVERFAVLVMTENHGADVKEANPPKR